jgi:hypothetical protein
MQDANVAFYPTAVLRQAEMAPGAEYIILHLQLLDGGADRFSTLVQWFAFIGNVVGVSALAALLGAGLRGQVFSAVVAVTVPMACLQAVSTQNDLVVSFWLVCFSQMILRVWKSAEGSARWRWFHYLLAGASLGLAILTKSTAYLLAAPFGLGLAGILLWKEKWRGAGALGAILAVAAMINLPMCVRNYRVSHDIAGNGGWPVQAGGNPYRNASIGVGATVSNLLRNSGLELSGLPDGAQDALERTILALERAVGQDPQDRKTTWMAEPFTLRNVVWRHEDDQPNPWHFALFVAAIVTLIAAGRALGACRLYALAIVAGFVLFCAYVRWQPWHSRLLLPLMMAASAFTGVVMERIWNRHVSLALAMVLPLFAAPLIIRNTGHPLIGRSSIFRLDRDARYCLRRRDLLPQYRRIVDLAVQNHCREVGLLMGGDDWEYPLDMMLRSALPGIRIECAPGKDCWSMDYLHTRNAGWDENLQPWMIVKINGATAAAVGFSQPAP